MVLDSILTENKNSTYVLSLRFQRLLVLIIFISSIKLSILRLVMTSY